MVSAFLYKRMLSVAALWEVAETSACSVPQCSFMSRYRGNTSSDFYGTNNIFSEKKSFFILWQWKHLMITSSFFHWILESLESPLQSALNTWFMMNICQTYLQFYFHPILLSSNSFLFSFSSFYAPKTLSTRIFFFYYCNMSFIIILISA